MKHNSDLSSYIDLGNEDKDQVIIKSNNNDDNRVNTNIRSKVTSNDLKYQTNSSIVNPRQSILQLRSHLHYQQNYLNNNESQNSQNDAIFSTVQEFNQIIKSTKKVDEENVEFSSISHDIMSLRIHGEKSVDNVAEVDDDVKSRNKIIFSTSVPNLNKQSNNDIDRDSQYDDDTDDLDGLFDDFIPPSQPLSGDKDHSQSIDTNKSINKRINRISSHPVNSFHDASTTTFNTQKSPTKINKGNLCASLDQTRTVVKPGQRIFIRPHAHIKHSK